MQITAQQLQKMSQATKIFGQHHNAANHVSICSNVCSGARKVFLQAATIGRVVTSTTSWPEDSASEPQAQEMMIALEVVFFFLHEAFEAARGWSRELKHAGQVCILWLALTDVTKLVVLGPCSFAMLAGVACTRPACTDLFAQPVQVCKLQV